MIFHCAQSGEIPSIFSRPTVTQQTVLLNCVTTKIYKFVVRYNIWSNSLIKKKLSQKKYFYTFAQWCTFGIKKIICIWSSKICKLLHLYFLACRHQDCGIRFLFQYWTIAFMRTLNMQLNCLWSEADPWPL